MINSGQNSCKDAPYHGLLLSRKPTTFGLKMGPSFSKFGLLAVDDEAYNEGEVTAVDAKVEIVATVEMAELMGAGF